LEDILDHLSRTVLETGRSGCSQTKLRKMVLHDSLSDFGQHLRDLQARFSVEYFNPKRLSLTKSKGICKILLNKKNL